MGLKLGGLFVVLLVGVAVLPLVYGVDIIVGGSSGWNQGFDYDTWSKGQTFKVGDNLVFNYAGNHKVDEVTEANYKSCSSSNPISSSSNGRTSVPLTAPGSKFFICPVSGHCESGMKLQIEVVAATTTPGGPPSPSPPSSTTPSPPSSTTPSPPSSTTPSPSGAVSVFVNFKQLSFGVFLATLFVL